MKNWHEDFADEPAPEDLLPAGASVEEMEAVLAETFFGTCEFCGTRAPREDFIETGMREYYTMDLDPGTLACAHCLEDHRMSLIPDDPSLIDCFTPLESVL